MSTPVETITARVDAGALTTGCRKGNISVSVDGVPPIHVIVDLDSPVLGLAGRTRCDYLFVAEVVDTGWVAPIELKSRTFRTGKVVRQLQSGAALASGWLPENVEVRFRPVLVHGGRALGKHRRQALDERLIEFRGDRVRVKALRDGGRLVDAFRSGLNGGRSDADSGRALRADR